MDKSLIDILINWFPMLLLIAVWIYFFRGARGGGWARAQRDAADRMERQTKSLERIADALEKYAASNP